jgi:HK97 family phage portal protein
MKILDKAMSFLGYEKKSSTDVRTIAIKDLREMFDSGLSPQRAFWLWAKSDSVGDAIDRIAEDFSQIRPVLIDKKTNEIIHEHPALDLIENPQFGASGGRLKKELAISYLAAGECYPVVTGNVNYEPSGMYQVYACNANILNAEDGYIKNIIFSAQNDTNTYNRQTNFKRGMFIFQRSDQLAETIMIKSASRSYGNRGQSRLERIYYQAMTKYYGNIHNTGLLKNASRPGGLWTPAKESLTQEQYEKFKEEVANFQGAYSAGKDVVAPQPVKYENFLLNPRDMDFINLIETSRVEIYGQYKIPLPLVVTKTMTLNNYSNSVLAYYDMSVMPTSKSLFGEIGRFILPRYKDGDRFVMSIDERDISALKERMMERAKTMATANVFSDNEIRTEAGYESYDGGDAIYKPAMLTPAGDDTYTGDNRKL